MQDDKLLLENQLCFPFYAISNAIIRSYGSLLKELNLTYPQYITMLVLWEEDNKTVSDLCERLFLKTNTLTPLLQKLEKKNLLFRSKQSKDERKVYIQLTKEGVDLKKEALCIPDKLLAASNMSESEVKSLRSGLNKILEDFSNSPK